MAAPTFDFLVHDERLAIARLDPSAPVPAWASGRFVTVSRTPAELSIVCAERSVPGTVRAERGRVAFGIDGVVPMTTTGILAALCSALAAAQVPVFVISTFDTDWLLVRATDFVTARRALAEQGHRVHGEPPAPA